MGLLDRARAGETDGRLLQCSPQPGRVAGVRWQPGRGGLGAGEARLGGSRRAPGRAQRPLGLVRAAPVRQPDVGHAVAAERGPGFQRLGERPFGPSALAGQQILPHRLPDQVMPEGVAVGVGAITLTATAGRSAAASAASSSPVTAASSSWPTWLAPR